jgi:hypothetical protein
MAPGDPPQAPPLVTTRFDRGCLYIPAVPALAVPFALAISTGLPMVLVVVVAETVIWGGWWRRWGRYWHPVKEWRWERAENRLGRPGWKDEQVSFREAWRRAGGDPPEDAHAPPSRRGMPSTDR